MGLLLALTLVGCDGDDEVAVTVANLNILHGFACDPPVPADGDQCRVADRIDLLVQHIAAADCPDVVTLQEHVTAEFVELGRGVMVGPLANTVALLQERLPVSKRPVAFAYQLVFDPEGATTPPAALGRGIDEELILTRFPAVDAEVVALTAPSFRSFSVTSSSHVSTTRRFLSMSSRRTSRRRRTSARFRAGRRCCRPRRAAHPPVRPSVTPRRIRFGSVRPSSWRASLRRAMTCRMRRSSPGT